MRGGSRGLVAAAAAALLAVGGATAIAVGAGSQEHPPQPAPSAAGSLGASPERAPADHPAPAVGATPSLPVAIDIPAIAVHSSLQHLGQAADGSLEVPAPGPHYYEAAWYRYSPTPGSLGPAIIEGHVDSATSGPSVFFRLGALQPGDVVRVTRADGRVAVFSVDGVRRYPKDRFPTMLVYGDTDVPALRLLTCGGAFDRATGHYLDNIVVFATLTSLQPADPRAATPTSGSAPRRGLSRRGRGSRT